MPVCTNASDEQPPANEVAASDLTGLGTVTQVLAAVVRHVDWAVVRCLVIAGPGFAKDAFRAHLDAEAVRRELRCAYH